jgi:hypothetical protein
MPAVAEFHTRWVAEHLISLAVARVSVAVASPTSPAGPRYRILPRILNSDLLDVQTFARRRGQVSEVVGPLPSTAARTALAAVRQH